MSNLLPNLDRAVKSVDMKELLSISLPKAPSSFKELLQDPTGSTFTFLEGACGLQHADSLISIINREIGKRQLHFRALTAAMRANGFIDYDAEEAFFLTSIYSDQLMISEPIITSSSTVATIHRSLGNTIPEVSSNNADPYTFFDMDIYGYSLSFGFTGLTKNDMLGDRIYSLKIPIIGIDAKLISELDDLNVKKPEVEPIFSEVIRYLWSISLISGHDHIHNLAGDLLLKLADPSYFKLGLDIEGEKLREQFGGKFINEAQAVLAQALTFNLLDDRIPNIKRSIFRQTLNFIDDISALKKLGLSDNGVKYLIFAGLAHARMFFSVTEEINGQTIGGYIRNKFNSFSENEIVDLESRKNGLSFVTLKKKESLNFTGVPIEDLEFKEITDYTDDHIYYYLKELYLRYKLLKDLKDRDIQEVPENSLLGERILFKSDKIPT